MADDRAGLRAVWRSVTGALNRDRAAETPSATERNVTWTGFYLLAGVALGAVIIVSYGVARRSPELAVTAGIIGGAALGVGFLAGFLFGIPRSRAESVQVAAAAVGGTAAAAAQPPRTARLRTNTNLEDMSDWLTKLLVGVGLTQVERVGPALTRFGDHVALRVGLGGAVGLFVQAVVVYFVVLGFLAGYLVTRLFLAGAFSEADKQLEELRQELEEQKRKAEGAQESADNLKLLTEMAPAAAPAAAAATPGEPVARGIGTEAPQQRLDRLCDEYNTIRLKEDSGPDRTRHMTAVLRQMMDLAPALDGADMARRLDDPDRGRRLGAYAYAYARPAGELLDPLVDSLVKYNARRRSDTDNRPFGEYWGIQALANVIAKRPPPRETIDRLRQWASTLERGTDRWAEMSRLLGQLGFDL